MNLIDLCPMLIFIPLWQPAEIILCYKFHSFIFSFLSKSPKVQLKKCYFLSYKLKRGCFSWLGLLWPDSCSGDRTGSPWCEPLRKLSVFMRLTANRDLQWCAPIRGYWLIFVLVSCRHFKRFNRGCFGLVVTIFASYPFAWTQLGLTYFYTTDFTQMLYIHIN